MTSPNSTIHKDFIKLFNKKERIALQGKKGTNLWFLFLILFFTFIAIGFANGSLKYLADKMKDPFVNWVDVKLKNDDYLNLDRILQELNSDFIRAKFGIRSTAGYSYFNLGLKNIITDGTAYPKGRTLEINNPLLDEILKPDNLAGPGRKFFSATDVGLIVTKNLLDRLGYSAKSPYIFMNYNIPSESDSEKEIMRSIPLPIVAVVKDLPGTTEFVCTPYFYINRQEYVREINPFNPLDERKLLIYTPLPEEKAGDLENSILRYLENHPVYGKLSPFASLESNSTFNSGFNIHITFEPQQEISELDTIYSDLVNSGVMKHFDCVRMYGYSEKLMPVTFIGKPGQIAVNFESPDKIREFADYLFEKHKIPVDIAQVVSKENYYFTIKLSRIISIILISFSILSICLFLSNLMRNHLEKIRMNLGTFKAFGLDDLVLRRIYMRLFMFFIVATTTFGLVAGWIFGMLRGMRLILWLSRNTLEKDQSYFNLLDYWTFVSLVLILSVSFIVLYFTAKSILKKSPGDLIYNR